MGTGWKTQPLSSTLRVKEKASMGSLRNVGTDIMSSITRIKGRTRRLQSCCRRLKGWWLETEVRENKREREHNVIL